MTAEELWLKFTAIYQANAPEVHELMTERKCRLFAVACSRRIWQHIPEGRSKRIIEDLERVADGAITESAWKAVCEAEGEEEEDPSSVSQYAGSVVTTCACDQSFRLVKFVAMYCGATVKAASGVPAWEALKYEQEEERAQCNLLRDLIPNPFRPPVTFSPEWRTDTALSLARQMYESRDFGAMPILADALQDAGCDSDDILDHCRGGGAHVRGCWVVDLMLGRS